MHRMVHALLMPVHGISVPLVTRHVRTGYYSQSTLWPGTSLRNRSPNQSPMLSRHLLTGSCPAAQGPCLYVQPELYDRAFSFRDFDEEVDFLEKMLSSIKSASNKSFIELGCGPARHTCMLQLKTGCRAIALDNSQQMLTYAKGLAADSGATVQFQHGDMQTFKLQKPVDMAFMILGTFAHLLDTEAALQCLRSTYAALKPNGLLVLELSHPADAFDGSLLEQTDWGGTDEPPEDGSPGELAVQYGKAGDVFDPIQQVLHRTVTVCEGDSTGALQQLVSEAVPQRVFTFQEIKLLAMMSNFSIDCNLGDMNLNTGIDAADAARMVVVLKRC